MARVIVDRKLITRLANLANLQFSENSLEQMVDEVEKFVGFIDEIETIGIDKSSTNPELDQAFALEFNQFQSRSDEIVESLPVAITMKNAPKTSGSAFEVPRVVET